MNYTELIGYMAAFCTTFAFLPQAVKAWKTRSAADLSLPMFLLMSIGLLLWLFYGIFIGSWPVIGANFLTLIFALSILYFKVRFG